MAKETQAEEIQQDNTPLSTLPGKRVRIKLAKEELHRAGEAMEATIINPTLARVLPVLLVLVAIYYGVGMLTADVIDADMAYRPDHRTENGYFSVDMAASLIHREVDVHGWKANNPFYVPSALLDNMPNFQIGLFGMLDGFVRDLGQTEPENENLAMAADKLGYDATRWYYQLSDPSAMPQPPAEDVYEQARNALLAYNMDRANSDVIWKPVAADLATLLDGMTARLDTIAATNRAHVHEHDGLMPDSRADDLFYRNKGQLYGSYMILLALSRDYDSVLAERKALRHEWDQMMDLLGRAVALSPLVVANGRPDGLFIPSHLSAQGFAVLDAKDAIQDMAVALREKPAPASTSAAMPENVTEEKPSEAPAVEPEIETQAGGPDGH